MKISTKGRYGLRAVVDIAVNSKGEHVSLFTIAQRQNVSENYLEHVFSTLRKANIVQSVKGAQGGYTISGLPSEITVGRILRALEGELSVVDKKSEELLAKSNTIEKCLKVFVWDKIDDAINKVVDSLTIEDLVEDYRFKNDQDAFMYYI
jgi:Rrf2 family transcriptional regulator, cysteine metabolism repressor